MAASPRLTLIKVKHSVGAATLLRPSSAPSHNRSSRSKPAPNPHTRKTRHAHEREQHRAGARPREAEHARDEYAVDGGLAQRGGDGEAADEEHDRGGEHHGEYKPATQDWILE